MVYSKNGKIPNWHVVSTQETQALLFWVYYKYYEIMFRLNAQGMRYFINDQELDENFFLSKTL